MSNGVNHEPTVDELVTLLRATDPDWILTRQHRSVLERAIMLSPTLETCEAMLRGERPPLSRLDPVQVRRYGIRRVA